MLYFQIFWNIPFMQKQSQTLSFFVQFIQDVPLLYML